MRLRCLPFMLALAFLAGCARLPPTGPIATPVKLQGTFTQFPSGLRMVVYQVPTAVRAELNAAYAVGSLEDPQGKEGLAHLVEHLAFRARHGGAGTTPWQERLLAIGGSSNAFTNHDGTDYQTSVPAAALGKALFMEGQRMVELLAHVTEEDFAAERDIVIAELRLKTEQTPWMRVPTELIRQAAPEHPYARPVVGTIESLRSLTLEDARSFVQRNYGPERAVLVVSSPVAPEVVVSLASKELGSAVGIEGVEIDPYVRAVPAFPESLAAGPKDIPVIRGNASRPVLFMGFTLPGHRSQRSASAELAEYLVGYNVAGHLDEDGRVASMGSFAEVLDGVSLVVAIAELKREEDAAAIADRMGNELRGVPYSRQRRPRLYRLAHAQMQTGTYLNLEHLPLWEAARFLRSYDNPDYVGGWLEQVQQAFPTGPDLLLEKFVVRERARFLLVVPEKGASGAADAVALSGGGRKAEQPREPEDMDPAVLANLASVMPSPELGRADDFVLENGLRVVAFRRPGMPVVDARLVLRTPSPTREEALATLPSLATHASWASRETIHAGLIGARQTAKVDSDGIVFGSAASSGNLVHVLDDIGRWLKRKDLYPFIFEPHRKRTSESLATQGTAFDREADWFAARLYGADHAYGVRGDPEACRRVGEGEVAGWLRRALQPANATLVLVGDLPPREALDRHLADWIGGWRAAASAKPLGQQQSPLPTASQWNLEPLKGATQTAIRVGVRFDRLDAADLASSDVLVGLLQDRLTRELRLKDGATYDVDVRRLLRPNAAGLEISTSVGVGASSRAVQLILAELAALRTEAGTPVGRIAMTRWQLARTFSARFDTASGIAAHMERALWLGWEPSVWDRYPEQLAKVDPDAVRRLAMRLELEAPVVSIVGDPGVVRPQLQQAGLAVP